MDITDRVEAGAAWLDEYGPANWQARIDLSRFDIRSGATCVIGQVFEELARDNGNSNGYSYLWMRFPYVTTTWMAEHGFEISGAYNEYDLLEAAWHVYLNDHDPARRAWHTYLTQD